MDEDSDDDNSDFMTEKVCQFHMFHYKKDVHCRM